MHIYEVIMLNPEQDGEDILLQLKVNNELRTSCLIITNNKTMAIVVR